MKWERYAIGTLTIAMLILGGIVVAPDDTHVCRDLEIAKKCDRLSSTGKTCYPYELTNVGKKYCKSGWEELTTEQIVSEEVVVSRKYRKEICGQTKCEAIE